MRSAQHKTSNNQATEPFILRFGWKKQVSCVRQTEASECGLACLAMIANYYGNGTSLSDLRESFSSSAKGTNLTALIALATELGLQTRGLRIDLHEARAVRLPYIAHFDLNHFVVVTSFKRGRVIVADPAASD